MACHDAQSGLNLKFLPAFGPPIVHHRKLQQVAVEVTHDTTWTTPSINHSLRDRHQKFLSDSQGGSKGRALSSPIDNRNNHGCRPNISSGRHHTSGVKHSIRPVHSKWLTRKVRHQTHSNPRTRVGTQSPSRSRPSEQRTKLTTLRESPVLRRAGRMAFIPSMVRWVSVRPQIPESRDPTVETLLERPATLAVPS